MALEWEPAGEELQDGVFDTVDPEQVLYELDSPMIFTFRNSGRLLLAYMCGEGLGLSRFVAVPTDHSTVDRILTGHCSVRDALDQPWCWCMDVAHDGSVSRIWATSLADFPSGALPTDDVMLNPLLAPLFAVKVEGRQLGQKNVPASVVKRAVDGAYTALKKLSEGGGPGLIGRPSESRRQLYDFSTRRVALGSFEISFGEPAIGQQILPSLSEDRDQMSAKGQELGIALKWAVSGGGQVPRVPLLEAMQKLAPPSQGLIETVRVSGSMLGESGVRYVLDRRVGRRVRQALSAARGRSEQVVTLAGEARELDKDRLSFRLRITGSADEYVCLFEEELYDDVLEAFASDYAIEVALRLAKGTRQGEVLAVSSKSGIESGYNDGGQAQG